jgi:hypothetical protein
VNGKFDLAGFLTSHLSRYRRPQEAVTTLQTCRPGFEPLIRNDLPALRRSRLSWVNQNFIRNETLTDANACLVATQHSIPLVHRWGGGEVASADGLRFVVPVGIIHAGPKAKYFGYELGVTHLGVRNRRPEGCRRC